MSPCMFLISEELTAHGVIKSGPNQGLGQPSLVLMGKERLVWADQSIRASWR